PEAKPFRKWITSEVLPSIRKTGRYEVPQQQPATPSVNELLKADKGFRASLRLAKAVGLKGNQAVLSANSLTQKLTGTNCLQLLDMTHLVAEKQERHFTPTDLGKRLGLTAKKFNLLLEEKGFQTSTRDSKKRLVWQPTEKAKSFAVLLDTGKTHSNGTPVQQLRWLGSIVDAVKD
ncbi:BRO-N domain-containing protein, partial [Magnetococcales bacterium HHB-1]